MLFASSNSLNSDLQRFPVLRDLYIENLRDDEQLSLSQWPTFINLRRIALVFVRLSTLMQFLRSTSCFPNVDEWALPDSCLHGTHLNHLSSTQLASKAPPYPNVKNLHVVSSWSNDNNKDIDKIFDLFPELERLTLCTDPSSVDLLFSSEKVQRTPIRTRPPTAFILSMLRALGRSRKIVGREIFPHLRELTIYNTAFNPYNLKGLMSTWDERMHLISFIPEPSHPFRLSLLNCEGTDTFAERRVAINNTDVSLSFLQHFFKCLSSPEAAVI